MRWAARTVFSSLVLLALASAAAPRVDAQARGLAPSGVELAFAGPSVVLPGHPMLYRGTAYRVRGLSTLEAYPRATLHARFEWGEERASHGAETDLTADADGRFALSITPPTTWEEQLFLVVTIDDGDETRSFDFGMSGTSAFELLVRTDRELYEPGEPLHVWALVRDARSHRPRAGEHVTLSIESGPMPQESREVTTLADGVASTTFEIPDAVAEGQLTIFVTVDGERHPLYPRIGTRTYSRLFARMRVEPELAEPGATAVAVVEVTTPSGAPVRDARVEVTIDRQTDAVGFTDARGIAHVPFTAPGYMPGDTSAFGVSARVHHPAHGEVFASDTLHLAVPLALGILASSRIGAGLVPEVDDTFFLVVTDGRGEPPAASVEIEVEGPAVRGGRAVVRTDASGIAEVPARLPAGTWAPGDSDGEGARSTSVLARIHGPLERTARLSIAVQAEAQVLPIVQRPLVTPGSRLEVQVLRRPALQRATLVAELLAGSEIVAVEHLAPGEGRVAFDVPSDRLGLMSVRVRALEDDERHEGLGTVDRFLVVPAAPTFVSIASDRPRYLVGETARIDVSGGAVPAGVRSFAAVMVRDLAAHDGEVPFRAYFLARAFEEAVLAPSAEGMRVVALALAADATVDEAGSDVPSLLDPLGLPIEDEYDGSTGTDVLRDPFPYARELERRGMADAMRSLEEMLREALANDALDELTTGRGPQRRFIDEVTDDLGLSTLGDGELTLAHLEAVDPSFRYETIARRVTRGRWMRVAAALASYLDPGDDAPVAARMAAREPAERWLPRMVERGLVDANDLRDPWGGQFVLVRSARPSLAISHDAVGLELVSPGPDGRAGTADDFRDPFARIVPTGTPYAVASGEDELLRRLSLLSPFDRAIEELAEAYARITAEMTEEEIGDAVHASVSEGAFGFAGIGLSGSGSGGGGGSGSGYGHGRGASVPRIRTGQATMSAFRGLARVLRERFPATLLFRPSVELDPRGHASVEVRLADAVTSYVVETIVWRTDGWIWSNDTRIEVEREIVVEAPIPEIARSDDAIALPVRVSNHGRSARRLVVSVLESPELGIEAGELRTIEVDAGDAGVTEFLVRPTREGRGHVRVAVATPEGEALDAIQLPLEVVRRSRRVRRVVELLGVGRGAVTLEIPSGATGRSGDLEVHVGEGLIAPSTSILLQRWAHEAGDPRPTPDDLGATSEGELAWRVAARWGDGEVEERAMSEAIDRLSQEVDQIAQDADPISRTNALSRLLLGLSPALDALDQRPAGERLFALVTRVRSLVSESAAQLTDEAFPLVGAAAALAWTTRGSGHDTLARELARRAERSVVAIGDEVFVASASDPIGASVRLALADARLGREERVLAVVATLSRWTLGGTTMTDEARTLARVATAAVASTGGRAREVVVTVDGAPERQLADGVLRFDLPALASPGAHVLEVALDARALVSARATVTYGTPWPTEPVRGPFALALEGDVGVLDGTSELALVVRNMTPRTIAVPVVEIDLPTGAELTASSRGAIASGAARGPDRSGDVLTVTLLPMPPGAVRRIPLPIRWSVGGTLVGLGVAAFSADREDRATILPPRSVTIVSREERGAR